MNLDYLNYLKEKKEIVAVALLGMSAFLAVLILIKVAGFFVASARAEGVVKKAVAQNNANAKDMETFFAESKAVSDELKRRNLFAPPPPKQQPIKQVWGILGDEVLINDRWYKVGDTVQDAKIVAIDCTQISIEWDGREITLAPIDAVSASPAKPEPKGPEVAKAGTGEGAEMVVVQSEAGPMFGLRGGEEFRGMRERFESMSEAERDRFRREMQEGRDRFMRMSEEERRRLQETRERWPDMSEAERERFRAEMRERFGGGPGRGPGGGPSRGPGGGPSRGPGGRQR